MQLISPNLLVANVVKLTVDKTYKLRPRNQSDARWFIFKPRVWVPSQGAWWGKSSTEHDLVVFESEMLEFDVIEVGDEGKPRCDCGAIKARTTHAQWCSLNFGV